MLVYRDRHPTRLGPPDWLVGAADLHQVEDRHGRCHGAGSGMLVGPAPDRAWTDLGDGWQVRIVDPLDPRTIARQIGWARTGWAFDAEGRPWSVPILVGHQGESLIRAKYGPGWVPQYTPVQQQALAAAQALRDLLHQASDDQTAGADVVEVDRDAFAGAAADVLCAGNHLTVAIVQTLGLLDPVLALGVARVCTSLEALVEQDPVEELTP